MKSEEMTEHSKRTMDILAALDKNEMKNSGYFAESDARRNFKPLCPENEEVDIFNGMREAEGFDDLMKSYENLILHSKEEMDILPPLYGSSIRKSRPATVSVDSMVEALQPTSPNNEMKLEEENEVLIKSVTFPNSSYVEDSGPRRIFEAWRAEDEKVDINKGKREDEEMGGLSKPLHNRIFDDSKRETDILPENRHATVSVDALLEALQLPSPDKEMKSEEEDPVHNCGYDVASGARRNFETWCAENEEVDIAKSNPEAKDTGDLMKSLERLILDKSKREMDIPPSVNKLKEMKLEDEDEALIKSLPLHISDDLLSVSGNLPFVMPSNHNVKYYGLVKRVMEDTEDWTSSYATYQLVSFHDEDLDKTVNEDGLLSIELNLEKQWQNFDYGFQYAHCGRLLLLVGGFEDFDDHPTNTFQVMHVDLAAPETVSCFSPLMKVPRVLPFGMLTVGKKLYVVGDGLLPGNRDHWVEVLDTDSLVWSSIKFPDEEVLVPLPFCWFWWKQQIHLLVVNEENDEGFYFYSFDLRNSEWRLLGQFEYLNLNMDYEFVVIGSVFLALGESEQQWAAYNLDSNTSTRISGIRYPGMDEGEEIWRAPDFVVCLDPWYCEVAYLRLFWILQLEELTIRVLKVRINRSGSEFTVSRESSGYFLLQAPDNLVQLFATDSTSLFYKSIVEEEEHKDAAAEAAAGAQPHIVRTKLNNYRFIG